MTTEPIRTDHVRPPSKSGETLAVARLAIVILMATVVAIGMRVGVTLPSAAQSLMPFQVLFRDVETRVQRMFRKLAEGLTEAENLRCTTKAWPTVDELAAQGIPPFAADAIEKVAYRWSLAIDVLYVNYVGWPESQGAPAFLVLVQEPDPLAPEVVTADTPLDEQHHRLADGTLLHVSFWFRARAPETAPDRVVDQPSADGWTQILAGTAAAPAPASATNERK